MKIAVNHVVDLGVNDSMPLDRVVTVRASNAILLVLMAITAVSALASYFDLGHTPLAVANVVFLLLYTIALLCNGAGLHEAGRFGGIAIGSLHYLAANSLVGARSGMEFYLVVLASLPFLLFSRNEKRKLAIGFAIVGLAAALTFVQFGLSESPVIWPEAAQGRIYYISLALMTAVTMMSIGHYNYASVSARISLADERARVEKLLSHVLPELIAEKLREGDTTIAESHGEASVLFADLVGFSALAKRLAPTHVVEVLNDLFSRLDELAGRHGVEKIKTIGDCYMAATGVLGHGEGQVEAMADFALAVPKAVKDVSEKYNYPLAVRVGISTGPAISGVIGTDKYSFDLWGDTVNLASQMEASGVEGRIQVTEATYWRLHNAFELEKRGEIAVKGETSVPSYFLIGRKQPSNAQADTDPLMRLVK
jgi:class 3 adenylate cyclase